MSEPTGLTTAEFDARYADWSTPDYWRIRALEGRVKKLEDRGTDGGCGCLFFIFCTVSSAWNIWTHGEVVRVLLRPWAG